MRSTVWLATRVISKIRPEQNPAYNALKIRSPTSVDFSIVMLVVLVQKVIPVVPNAPVATRVKPVLALVVLVKNVPRVNLVRPMIKTLLLARRATPANTKKNKDKQRVTSVF